MMRIIATIRMALRAMRRNKMRSVLTMLGIIIGVGAVIVTVGMGNGGKAQIEAGLATLGRNVIMVFSGSVTRGGASFGFGSSSTLTVADADAIRREVPGVVAVSPEVRTGGQLVAGNNNWSSQILGVSEEYLIIRQWNMADGAFFSLQDVRSANKVAVIGQSVADKLFPDGNVVGQIMRIRSAPFVVVGLLSKKGMSMMGQDQDDVVLVPFTSAMRRLGGSNSLRSMNVQAESPEMMPSVQYEITALLRQRHKIREGGDDDFIIRTQQEISEMMNESSKTMRILIAVLACVTLIVAGIGIMNIMLVSVTERTREIGIRLAVGAKSRDIMFQFLIEALTMCLVGGTLGIFFGLGIQEILKAQLGWTIITSVDAILFAFICSVVIGVFFGFYPASKASRLDPITALRYE